MSGENDGVVNTLLELWKSLYRQEKKKKRLQDAWYHPNIDTKGILCTMQLYVKQIIGEYSVSSAKIIGFKEIRHTTDEQLQFFRVLFPCARYIVNTRNDLQAQSRSGHHHRDNISINILRNNTRNILKWAENVPNSEKSLFYLSTESLSVRQFNRLLDWVGVRGCSVIGLHHSHNGSSYDHDNRDDILPNKEKCIIAI